MRSSITGLSRSAKISIVLGTDALLIPLAVWLSFSLRLGIFWLPSGLRELLPMVIATGVALATFHILGVYRTVVRYMDASVVSMLVKGVSLAALVLIAAAFLLEAHYPRSIPLIFWFIAMLLISGSRVMAQMYLRGYFGATKIPAVIYGAGEAGLQMGMALCRGGDYHLVGYVDDDPALKGVVFHGVRVYEPESLGYLKREYEIKEIFMALPEISGSRKRGILNNIERYAIRVRTVPSLARIMQRGISPDDVQDVDPIDLLGRDVVPSRPELMSACLTGKVVMVTGAGGSIGSELCRQISKHRPEKLILFDVSEYGLYQIEGEIVRSCSIEVRAILGSVQNKEHLHSVMSKYRVQTLYHAAAYKHVPMVEFNAAEAVRNNVIGTKNAAEVAGEVGVETFVLISTDKAVRPTNVMGATKRLAELVVSGAAQNNKITKYTMVRFGNVLGSSGSVIPLFKSQILSGGPVTVTHPEVTRYFMTIPEAAQLVIQAGAMSGSGGLYLLDMGEPVKIYDLAKRMIHLMGYVVSKNGNDGVAIEVVGLRPGEKLYEELLIGNEAEKTSHPRIMRGLEPAASIDGAGLVIQRLLDACEREDEMMVREILRELPLDFNSGFEVGSQGFGPASSTCH